MSKIGLYLQGRRQKNFQGGGQRKKRPKNTKKRPKNSTIKPLTEKEANGKKTEK